MIRTVAYFLAGALIGWIAVGGICYLRWKTPGVYGSAATGMICLLPTTLSLLLALWSKGRSAADQLLAIFGGMALRVFVVLGLGLTVFLAFPYFRQSGDEYAYWGSLLIYYLFTLGWETFLLARGKPGAKSAIAEGVGE